MIVVSSRRADAPTCVRLPGAAHGTSCPDNGEDDDVRLRVARLEPVDPSQWTEEQHRDLDPILDRTGARNVLGTFVHHWTATKARASFGRHILGPTSTLAPRHREISILRVAWLCQAEYEWAQHKIFARGVGLSDEDIERIKRGPDAPAWEPADALVLRATDELVNDTMISDDTWHRLTATHDTQQIVDLIHTVGSYVGLAMLVNSIGIQLDDGYTGFEDAAPET